MNFEITSKPDFAMLNMHLEPNQSLQVETGAMVAMSSNIELETKARGGILSSAKRAFLGGESFFMNRYTARNESGLLQLAPGTPGDVHHQLLEGGNFMVQSGSFLACDDTITMNTKWGGLKTFFGGEGLFMLQAQGHGHLFFSSYGAIHEVDVSGSYIVDTGHIVAFEDSLSFHVRSIAGIKSLFFSGEGLVCEFQGTGKVFLQSRSPSSFVQWIHPFRPIKKRNNSE